MNYQQFTLLAARKMGASVLREYLDSGPQSIPLLSIETS